MIFLRSFERFFTLKWKYAKRQTGRVREGSVKGPETHGISSDKRGIIIDVIGGQTKSSAMKKAGGNMSWS